jgi:hypothetical protein
VGGEITEFQRQEEDETKFKITILSKKVTNKIKNERALNVSVLFNERRYFETVSLLCMLWCGALSVQ